MAEIWSVFTIKGRPRVSNFGTQIGRLLERFLGIRQRDFIFEVLRINSGDFGAFWSEFEAVLGLAGKHEADC